MVYCVRCRLLPSTSSALAPVMDEFFDTLPDDYSYEFHCGITVSGIMAQTNWLGELVLHGDDIARSIGVPWEFASATRCCCSAA